jgi:hypothetical protein
MDEITIDADKLGKVDVEALKKALQGESLKPQNEGEQEFKDSIKGVINIPSYGMMTDYIQLIQDSEKLKSLVLVGDQGLGKSTFILNELKQKKIEFAYYNNYTTALAFYQLVYKNRDKMIVLDDIDNLLNDGKAVAILKAITDTKKAYVTYESNSDKMGSVPKSFIFEGKVVILTNRISGSDKLLSLLDRAIYRRVSLTLEEKKALIVPISMANYKLTEAEAREIEAFVIDRVERCGEFSFRTICRVCEFYLHNQSSWMKMADEELKPNEEWVLIGELEATFSSVGEQVREWIRITGKSRATFFNIKKKMKESKSLKV